MMLADNRFYDDLAADYHLMYADWHASVRHQGAILTKLFHAHRIPDSSTVLDCSCGIGTQAIGLALNGYIVRATDLSERAVERAKREALLFDVEIDFGVADVRELAEHVDGTFDVVLSADNSLPHLLTDDDLREALAQIATKLVTGGLLVVGIRDYDALVEIRPHLTTPQVNAFDADRSIVFQL
jgi:glycine/sarcosine N-methyltransferase